MPRLTAAYGLPRPARRALLTLALLWLASLPGGQAQVRGSLEGTAWFVVVSAGGVVSLHTAPDPSGITLAVTCEGSAPTVAFVGPAGVTLRADGARDAGYQFDDNRPVRLNEVTGGVSDGRAVVTLTRETTAEFVRQLRASRQVLFFLNPGAGFFIALNDTRGFTRVAPILPCLGLT